MMEAALSDAVRRGAQLYGAVNCFIVAHLAAKGMGQCSSETLAILAPVMG